MKEPYDPLSMNIISLFGDTTFFFGSPINTEPDEGEPIIIVPNP